MKKGRLTQIQLDYPADFNFAYDVVDAMARLAPQQKALVWCNSEGQEAQFTFADISRRSSQAAPGFLQRHPPGRPGDGGAEAPL